MIFIYLEYLFARMDENNIKLKMQNCNIQGCYFTSWRSMDNLEKHIVKPYKNHENRYRFILNLHQISSTLTTDNLKFTHLFRTHAK